MTSQPPQKLTFTALASAGLVTLLGLTVISGWYLRLPQLIQIQPHWVPMQFNTALCFLLSGLGAVAAIKQSITIARVLAGLVLLLASLILIQASSGLDLHIDEIFFQHYLSEKTSTPGRMSPNSAVCFVLAALAILAHAQCLPERLTTLANSFIPPTLIAITLVALSGYWFGLTGAYSWDSLDSMAIHTAVGFILLALTVLLYSLQRRQFRVLPAVAIGLLVATFILWRALLLSVPPAYANRHILYWVLAVGLILDTLIVLALCGFSLAKRQTRTAKRLQRSQKDSLTLYQTLLDASPSATLLVDSQGLISLANPAAYNLFGYQQGALEKQPIEILIPPALHHQHVLHRKVYQQDNAVAKRMASDRRVQAYNADGELIPVEVHITPVVIKEHPHALAIVSDIRQREEQRVIQKLNERFVMASQAANLGFWEYDAASGLHSWDEGMFRLYGYNEADHVNPNSIRQQQIHPEDLAHIERELQLALSTASERVTEIRVFKESGEMRYLQVVMTPRLEVTDHPATHQPANHLYGVKIDITEIRVAQQKQKQLVQQLTRSNAELDSFAHVASHDLKSPLRGIDQLANWISQDLSDTLSEDTQKHLRLMRSRIDRMEQLLDDLLSYARVGREHNEPQSVDTHQLIQGLFDLQAPSKPFTLHLGTQLPTLHTEKAPLELVLRNLLSNAIKHHTSDANGNLWVEACRLENSWQFSVRDDGPGIAPNNQQRVFGMLQRLRPRDAADGSGMGLALVKKTIESVGGEITLDSDGQHGCTFNVTWPDSVSTHKYTQTPTDMPSQ